MRRLPAAGAVAAVVATALLAGGALRSGGDAVAAPTSRQLVRVGFRELDAARRTGEPTHYGRAEQALREALAGEGHDAEALVGLASLANSRHRFREGLRLARQAHRLAPEAAVVDAVLGDSLVELGRYDEAFRVVDRLAARKPGLTAYARVSYARELLGQRAEAVEAMSLAVDAAGDSGEPAAWSRTQLGKLYFSQGRLGGAAVQYRTALELEPGYVQALDALARVEAARGNLRAATSLELQAVEQTPLPQYAGFLGDLYRLRGLGRQAGEQYRLVAAVDRLFAANGVATDLELALFDVDHGFRLRESVVRARRVLAERPSIEAEGVLAWALARTGRCEEALRHSRRALRLGTLDAPKFFQRGMIERCLGRRRASQRWFRRALRTNPYFSPVWVPVARRLS